MRSSNPLFQVTVLGCASATPIPERHPSAQALCVRGRWFLVDCGEGTVQRLVEEHVPMGRLEAVFLSHAHGDHVFGLPGLLSALGMQGRKTPLPVYGPSPVEHVVSTCLKLLGSCMPFSVSFTPLQPGEPTVFLDMGEAEALAFPLRHSVPTLGYLFREKHSAFPRSCAYCSDTAPFPEEANWLRGVSALYHEATYLGRWAAQASRFLHSTTLEAAHVALEAGVERLFVGHYSARERNHAVYEAECRQVFPATCAAQDGTRWEV